MLYLNIIHSVYLANDLFSLVTMHPLAIVAQIKTLIMSPIIPYFSSYLV